MHMSNTIIINSILMCIHLTFSGYWIVVFMRRIHCSRKYKKGAARCMIDEESEFVNQQVCYHYETEIWKYVYLLGISFLEILSGLFYMVAHIIASYGEVIKEYNTTLSLFEFSGCQTNPTKMDETTSLVISLYNFLHGVGRSTELLWIVLSVCLMNYLIVRIKKIKLYHNTRDSFDLLLRTTWLCLFIICSNTIHVLQAVSYFTFQIALVVYASMFVRTCNNLKRALLQRALERLIQHGSNSIEMREYRYFKYTINIICWFILCICIGQSLVFIPRNIMGVLINHRCYLPFNLFQFIYSFEQSEEMIEISSEIIHYMKITGTVICYIGLFFATIPFVLITCNYWIRHILKFIRVTHKAKYSTQPTVSPSLQVPLLA